MTSDVRIGKGIGKGLLKITAVLGVSLLAMGILLKALPPATEEGYRFFPVIGSRFWVWVVAQIHLNFAAFVLGVPIFTVVMEYLGWRKADARLDRLAYDFTKLFTLAATLTGLFGGILLVSLPVLYPRLVEHLLKVLGPTGWVYLGLIYLEVFLCYLYYYTWHRMADRKGAHLLIGVALNVVGTALLFVANSWIGYMTTPGGVTEAGEPVSLWGAIATHMWMPLNIHRLLANVVFGAGIVAAYAAYRFLTARSEEDRAYYDWMGYISATVAIGFFILLPFAGYWLGVEIYSFNEQMGIQLMGGFFAWLWVMQAVLICALLFFSNYYLWVSLSKMPGGERYLPYVKYLFGIILLGCAVWLTPHSVAVSLEEARRIGGAYHPILGNLGVMAAKNTAVSACLLATFISYSLFRNANREPTVSWRRVGVTAKIVLVGLGAVVILGIGVYSYLVPAAVRVKVLSPIQFLTLLTVIASVFTVDAFLYRGARSLGAPRWGQMPDRSQYALIALTVTFTWLMGLMGYIRSGGRQYWHVYGILQDTSPWGYLPAHGTATWMVSIATLLFLSLVGVLFGIVLKAEKEGA